MAAGDTHVADPLDTVYHEMDSMVHGHHVYKSVWSPVVGEQLVLEKEPANPHDEFAVAVIKDSQIVGHILKKYLQIMWYFLHEGALSSHITGRRRTGKA